MYMYLNCIITFYVCMSFTFSVDINDHFDIKCELVDVAHKWKEVGGALRLNPDLLSTIEADHPNNVTSCLDEVLIQWLKKMYDVSRFGQPSWKLLVAAVAHPAGGNNCALAEKIAANHNGILIKSVQYMQKSEQAWVARVSL